MNIALGLFILVASVIGYAIVNSIEIAVVGANRIRVHHLAESGSSAAQALQRLHGDLERFFAAIVLLQNIMVVVAASVGSLVANDLAGPAGIVASIFLIPVATTEFGELTPKVLAARASDRLALLVALPAEGLTRLLAPFVWALGFIPGLLSRRLFGMSLDAGPSVTEAELRMLIDKSAETGTMAEDEAELLDRVFHFGDRRVHEVMVPRTETVWLERESKIRDFYEVYTQAPHSRFPVCDETPDQVVGILGIKDVLTALAAGTISPDNGVEALLRPAYFVPESKPIRELFREMQMTGTQMAIAVDEFGGIAGIVTMEQLVEEMVGPIHDELRPAEGEIQPIDERTIQVDGGLSIEEAREELGIEIPEGPYDTIAGFVLDRLGHIPEEGEQLPLDEHSITVAEMKGPKIELLRVTRG